MSLSPQHFQLHHESIINSRAHRIIMGARPRIVIDNINADLYIQPYERDDDPNSPEITIVITGPSEVIHPIANRLKLKGNTLSLVVEDSYTPRTSEDNSRVFITLYIPMHTILDIKNVHGFICIGNVASSSLVLSVVPKHNVYIGSVTDVDLSMGLESSVSIEQLSFKLIAQLAEGANLKVTDLTASNVRISVSRSAGAYIDMGNTELACLSSDDGEIRFLATSKEAVLSAINGGEIEINGDNCQITRNIETDGRITVT